MSSPRRPRSPRPFEPEQWQVREEGLHLERLAQSESVFALGNGHIGVRGNLDEGEPYGLPGTYLNGFFESRPLPYAEAGYGYPEAGQTVVDVTNGKLIRLLVDDEPFDVRYGQVDDHERVLDLRAGVLRRDVRWTSPGGSRVRVCSTRMVSLVQRAVMAIEYVVEAVEADVRVVVQSELVANEEVPVPTGDPRVAVALDRPLEALDVRAHDNGVHLVHRTRRSKLTMAAHMDHLWDGPEDTSVESTVYEDVGRTTFIAVVGVGRPLRIVKFVTYGWSSGRTVPALRDQVGAAAAGARHTGWEGLLDEQRRYLDAFWERSDVRVEGDGEIQQAVRFALFQILQAGARSEQRAIPAKGLTGPGYDGHAFWDTEIFVLPVLTYSEPHSAADALRWRQSILPAARARARALRLSGAVFPWRTIGGEECSAYWPAGSAALHIGADVADAARRYVQATGDADFERDTATELYVETARVWMSAGFFDEAGAYRIDGVTGPDEYSALADNNVYTNLMAARNLQLAADAVERHQAVRNRLQVAPEEVVTWRRAAAAIHVPWDEDLGIHPQSEGFTDHERWDFSLTGAEEYPLMLHYPYLQLYRKQVVKQADLVLAMLLRGDRFSAAQKVANFAYYEGITVRDSSLSAAIQCILAAETGHLDLAYDYWGEAALMDLHDLERNTRDGLHLAALAGAWLGAVFGFGGMRDHGPGLLFRPRLPTALRSLGFTIFWHGGKLAVEVDGDAARYRWDDSKAVRFRHYDDVVELRAGEHRTVPIPPLAARPPLEHPPHRRPEHRVSGG
ncbi:family 65 glycosyl hydrolase [Acidimicrobiaceae bacterium USS-CC1]|uniref:Family 65 glycosyl hydrolase n=1 Tax=Acidiferrimicrobium australe TaxID=2664430 RepID=A0ABW9QVS8_9ACTN|nr:family 65 glycosyl hydrolase [Acidiferrimicrobium australe]